MRHGENIFCHASNFASRLPLRRKIPDAATDIHSSTFPGTAGMALGGSLLSKSLDNVLQRLRCPTLFHHDGTPYPTVLGLFVPPGWDTLSHWGGTPCPTEVGLSVPLGRDNVGHRSIYVSTDSIPPARTSEKESVQGSGTLARCSTLHACPTVLSGNHGHRHRPIPLEPLRPQQWVRQRVRARQQVPLPRPQAPQRAWAPIPSGPASA